MSQNNSENTQQDDLPKGQADDASLPQETLSGDSANDGTGGANLDLVLDIPITVSMEIGRTKMRIKDLLNLSSGSIVELQKMVDEPLDLLVNGTLVARGEVVVVDKRFGVRLIDVVSRQERLGKIQ